LSCSIQNRQQHVRVSSPRLRRIAARTLAAVGRLDRDVHVTVVDDRAMRRLNHCYLGARRATDVLAFNLETAGPSRLLGTVIISGETAARQANRLRVPAALELDLLLIHGVLHLAGYDDHAPRAARLMHEREREILSASRQAPIPERLWTDLLDPVPRDRMAARSHRARPRRPR
jgi:rRNA maturation RNase YbeY